MKLGYDFDVKDNYMVRSAKWLGEMAETDRGQIHVAYLRARELLLALD